MMKNPLSLIQMWFLEFRWIIIVYYALYTLEINTLKAVFTELFAKDSTLLKHVACVGLGKYEKELTKEFTDIMWGDYIIELPKPAKCPTGAAEYTDRIYLDASKESVVTSFFTMNVIMVLTFITAFVLYPIYLFVTGKGNWYGTSFSPDMLETLNKAKLSLLYRRYLMVCTFTVVLVAIWTLYEGFKAEATGFISNFIAGIITVILALPKQTAKVMDAGDIEEGTAKLKAYNRGIGPKIRQILLVNSDGYSAQLAHLNFPDIYKMAAEPSILPGPLQAMAFFQACFGEGDIDIEAPTTNKTSSAIGKSKAKGALGKAKDALDTADSFGFSG